MSKDTKGCEKISRLKEAKEMWQQNGTPGPTLCPILEERFLKGLIESVEKSEYEQ